MKMRAHAEETVFPLRSRLAQLASRLRASAAAARSGGFRRLASSLDEQGDEIEELASSAQLPSVSLVDLSIAGAEHALAIWRAASGMD